MIEATQRQAGIAACLFAGTAVLAGAFATHALRDRLAPEAIAIWHTAVDYQFWHALALLGLACLSRQVAPTTLRLALRAFVAGIILFSGSLYALSLGAPRWIGTLTPFGGLAFLVGWVCLLVFLVRSRIH
ncbi:MAG: DUF423 domain-containing protein [Xanthomonadales bacterium]|nr:DUF423 domain-containing protein [Xanthomonadales bacterium]